MVISSVLVAGDGPVGRAAALAFAERGLDVTHVARARPSAYAVEGMPVPALPHRPARADDTAVLPRLRTLGVEYRPGATLVGSVPVDRHVEAEFADGRIENYDLIAVIDTAGGVRLIAARAIERSTAFDIVRAALGAA